MQVDADESLETLKAILEAESGLVSGQQVLVLNGNNLPARCTLLPAARAQTRRA
jgi:hypothetical protein